MATVTVLLNKKYTSKSGEYPIIIRVIDGPKQRLISVGYKVSEKFWQGNQVGGKHPDAHLINSVIASKEAEVKKYLADCKIHGKPIHLDLIGTGHASYSFTQYVAHRARQYKEAGKPVMRRKLERYVKELKGAAGREVFFEDVGADFLRKLEAYMISMGNVENTRHKKFETMGDLFTAAMNEGKAVGPNPFRLHKIPTKPVKKEKLTEAEVKAIEELKLSPGPLDDARNLFLLSFYCKGIRFSNCIMLRKENVKDGRVYVRTTKGGKYVSTKIHARLQAILDRYPDGEFVLPYVDNEPADPEEFLKLVSSRNTIVNRNLKIVAALAGITKTLTFHIARHTFANLLMKKSKIISVVQEGLGHSDERTTRIYTNALDDEILDPEMEKLYGI